jgi:NAD+ synthase
VSLVDEIAGWIRGKVEQVGATGVVVGLSGGVDSATVAALSARALGPDRVLGAVMPAHSNPEDLAHAELAARTLDIHVSSIDLSGPFDAMLGALPSGNDIANANLKPRLRMLTLYYLANTRGLLVAGTGNKSELLVGYFTKYGDGGVDILPLGGLYKHQVRTIARELGVPDEIVEKAPSAGLWADQTDEGELGITYEELDATLEAIERGDSTGFRADLEAKVRKMVEDSEHKRHTPPIFDAGSCPRSRSIA